MNNQRGSTIVEHIVTIFILSIMSLLVFTGILSGSALFFDSYKAYDAVNTDYDRIEQSQAGLDTSRGTLEFDRLVDDIDGTYYHGDDIGEFTTNAVSSGE